jgi:hypothetical protein
MRPLTLRLGATIKKAARGDMRGAWQTEFVFKKIVGATGRPVFCFVIACGCSSIQTSGETLANAQGDKKGLNCKKRMSLRTVRQGSIARGEKNFPTRFYVEASEDVSFDPSLDSFFSFSFLA